MAQLTAQFFQTILKIEGGYQNHPSDSGNYCEGEQVGTKYGMSAVAVGTWWGRCPSAQEMRDLTTSDAMEFYSWYFNIYNLYQVQNQQFFELLANNAMGSPKNAAKVAQRVLNDFGYAVSLDGAFGPQTLSALNQAWNKHGSTIYNAIRNAWVDYLKALNRPEFIAGWLYRMNKYFPLIGGGGGTSIWLPLLVVGVGFFLLKKRKQ